MKKDRKLPEKRIFDHVQHFSASSNILEAAEFSQNDRVLLALSGTADAIAGDIVHHQACYRNFTRKDSLDKLRDSSLE